jgi:DeoR/GlpR family transcriptional regulator of sugar metabolism
MDAAERQSQIIEVLLKKGRVSVPDICDEFQVSEMTARRDLARLERQGLLRRYHGGAEAILGRSYEPSFKTRASKFQAAKAAIGWKAAELVKDGESVALDVGTTTLEIVPALVGKRNLTIVTSCLQVANMVVRHLALDVAARLILTGGIVRPRELSMVGPIPERVYDGLHVDKAFIAAAGISVENGLTEFNVEDAQIKQVLIRHARECILVADGSKFGVTTFTSFAPLSAVKTIVTDESAPKGIVEEIRGQGVEVLVAD